MSKKDRRGILVGPLQPISEREMAALTPHWKTVIEPSDRKIFLWMEGMYTSTEEFNFRTCTDKEEREEWRLRTLEKRKVWLLFWLENIYHIENNNAEST